MVKKVHITLSEKAINDLEKLKNDLGLSSLSDVVRSSISVNKFLQQEKEAGNEIILRNKKTSKEKLLVMLK